MGCLVNRFACRKWPEMSNQPELRQPGKRVFEKPKPQLTLIKLGQEHKPRAPINDKVTKMLRQMREQLRDTSANLKNGSDAAEAA